MRLTKEELNAIVNLGEKAYNDQHTPTESKLHAKSFAASRCRKIARSFKQLDELAKLQIGNNMQYYETFEFWEKKYISSQTEKPKRFNQQEYADNAILTAAECLTIGELLRKLNLVKTK